MKLPKGLSRTRKSSIPQLRFEKQDLSSYGGLVVFQKLFAQLDLSARLSRCEPRRRVRGHFSYSLVLRLLIVNVLLGMRRLRDVELYREDPVVRHVLGVRVLPGVSTISRMLEDCDERSVSALQAQGRELVLERLAAEKLATVTLDFDGSVISTRRKAEGTAVGFNRKKGLRSYYPLFCTVAQSGQILQMLHRPGNVHDSNGSVQFVRACVQAVREVLPSARIETRMDSAFFSEEMLAMLEQLGVEYALSVPFERFAQLKDFVENRRRWKSLGGAGQYRAAFSRQWKPACWSCKRRFLFVRTANPRQTKGALQLDLFEPRAFEYDYKCVLTNKRCGIKTAVRFLEGRGQQENVFSELKSQGALAYVPCRRQLANRTCLLCAILAHNLGRELQMRTWDKLRHTQPTRPALWVFEKIQTLRNSFICKAARFIRPAGTPTLVLNANPSVQRCIHNFLQAA